MSVHDDFSIEHKIEEAEIVSFDVFDTLLLRNVMQPTDIFKAVEIEYYRQTGHKVDFFNLRIKAEEEARANSMEEDISLDDIYFQLEKKLGNVADDLKKIEIDTEFKFIVPNKFLKKIYHKAILLKKKIYIISDMYLPGDVIEKLLKLNGFDQFHGLFVSSEMKVTKATGSMYKKIMEKENIDLNKKWLHIGDNFISDVSIAQSNGLQAHYYKKLFDREDSAPVATLGESIIRAMQLIDKYSYENNDYWHRFGVDQVAPLYIGLMLWIIKEIEGRKIYFLSRDGYVPYKLYQEVKKYYPELPEAQYLYASRRAYIYPSLLFAEKSEAIKTLMLFNDGMGQVMTLKEILLNLGLDLNKYLKYLKKFEIQSFDIIIHEGNSNKVKQFLDCIWDDITECLEKELSMLMKYFKQMRVDDKKEFCIFDVGWSGSTHRAMQRILNLNIHGLYFGTLASIDLQIKENSKGYIFSNGKPAKIRNHIIDHIMMYEFIFSAPEGSLVKFDMKNNQVVPVLKNVEKNSNLYEIIRKFQDSAIDFFKQLLLYRNYIDQVRQSFSIWSYKKFITSYKPRDMLMFSNLTNSIGIGYSQDTKKYITVIGLDEYLNHRKMYNRASKFNLWKYGIVIKDDQGRYFNRYEVERLYRLNKDLDFDYRKYIKLIKKAVANPKKAWKKLLVIIQTFFS